ncbi:unnamed protein product [Moneuplotes crassus]|uniref:P-type ATPase A domain-containing protein n=2 Tax=Euplotes crassus TaxID=5936 RepID=A0AAD1XYG8_EUPCR|nr:unnamed protein product [Moneuplotes crassus]
MNINALRDLIRDYTQAFDQMDINKRLLDSKITKKSLEDLLHHKDTAKSMATYGVNKIFQPEKVSNIAFDLNKFEKLILACSIVYIMFWFLLDYNIIYALHNIAIVAFLLGTKKLGMHLDRKAESISEKTEENKPSLDYIVKREGRRVKIEETDIVVGDLIYLKAGIRIPVDGFMVTGNSLIVNEFAISGEPQNHVKKSIENCKGDATCPVLLSHTHVVNGCGWMIAISIGDKTTGYAKQCVEAHQSFKEDFFETISRTKIEFLYIGYSKVFRNVLILTGLMIPILCVAFLYRTEGAHSIVVHCSRYFFQAIMIVYFSQQFLVEKAYDKYFKYCCYELSNIGIYLNKPECFEEVQKIKRIVVNRQCLGCNEYILQKLWLGNEIAEFEQNFDDLEITKPLQADEETVEILTQALLGNIDEVIPNKIDRSFVRFLVSIVGITEEELSDQIANHYKQSNFRSFPNSENKRMMTLIDQPSGDKKLLIKGSFEDLYRQCTYYVDDEGNSKKIDNDARDRIKNSIIDASSESTIAICICTKDISRDDLNPQKDNHDSGGPSEEEFEEFLNDQADLTLVSVALFKNPVNIWIPSCISKIHKTKVKTLLVSSSATASYYANECGIISEGHENEEIEAKDFYEKAQNNRFWLEHHLNHIKVLSNANAIHKHYLTECLLNFNEDTIMVSNKPCDLKSIRRAQIGISSLEIDNSMLFDDSSIVLSKRGFLEVHNLFKYATYMEECTKESYIYCIGSILSMTILSLVFAICKGDTLFEPVHYMILLALEIGISEFLFTTIVESEEIANEQIDSEDLIKGYSLDEKSRKTMMYHIFYTVLVPIAVLVFNILSKGESYYIDKQVIDSRLQNGIPELNSFIFIFILISRLCCLLNFRCKSVQSWLAVIQRKEFLVIFFSILLVIFSPYFSIYAGYFLQVAPISLFMLLIAVALGFGTLSLRLLTTGLRVLKDSKGFKLESTREMQRLDFTNDFD